jgi:excisionase family DNA binding protein
MTYSIKQVAERFGVSIKTVLLWIKSGELRAVNCSRSLASKKPRYRVSQESLTEFELLRQAPTASTTRRRKRKQPNDVIQFYS